MPELADETRTLTLNRMRGTFEAFFVPLLITRHDCAMRKRRRIDRDHLRDDRSAATSGTFGEEVDPAIGDAMIRPKICKCRRQYDAVAQGPLTDLHWAKEPWETLLVAHSCPNGSSVARWI